MPIDLLVYDLAALPRAARSELLGSRWTNAELQYLWNIKAQYFFLCGVGRTVVFPMVSHCNGLLCNSHGLELNTQA